MGKHTKEPMLEIFIFETTELLGQLEQLILASEREGNFDNSLNEIFRIMHTIKGAAATMEYSNIAELAHCLEDLFAYLREKKSLAIDSNKLSDIALNALDFMKSEVAKIDADQEPNGDAAELERYITNYLAELKSGKPEATPTEQIADCNAGSLDSYFPKYKAVVFFEDGCEMENVRAFAIVHRLKDIASCIEYIPGDIVENNKTAGIIKRDGFKIVFSTNISLEDINVFFEQIAYLERIELEQIDKDKPSEHADSSAIVIKKVIDSKVVLEKDKAAEKGSLVIGTKQDLISVSVKKLDMLMNLVGELVVSEAMVTRNPELAGLSLDSFHKAAGQLRKITSELQDIVMSIRLVPLAQTFQKMSRIVRDASRKLGKEVRLDIAGENTEVDKNIIEHISDPLMHLIRNAIDHGIEKVEEREQKRKNPIGKIELEARNAGGDVWIAVKDDGKGLNRAKIIKLAKEKGLLKKAESELTEREINSLIFLPGFSTKEDVSEFSGRGVGMDVVLKNIEKVHGTISVDSTPDVGTNITIKIPLTLAIINGMNIKVGDDHYTIPMTAIRESFRAKLLDIIKDPDGNEMIMIRGKCYPILRLYELYDIQQAVIDIEAGIIIMLEVNERSVCLFVDALLGEQQVVVKPLPGYVKKVKGIAGCTILGDGSISLILDVSGLMPD